MKIQTQYQLIMPIGQSKAMWQCKWRNLVANFGTNARDITWWPNFEPICKKSENAYLEEIQNWNFVNLKFTNTRMSQSRFSGQREQTLSTSHKIYIVSRFFSHFIHTIDTNYMKLISVRKIIQVIDSIPWVRCASGNVWLFGYTQMVKFGYIIFSSHMIPPRQQTLYFGLPLTLHISRL